MSKILLRIFFLILFLPLLATSYSLQPNAVLTAQRTSLAPQIDGLLTDECWKQAKLAIRKSYNLRFRERR